MKDKKAEIERLARISEHAGMVIEAHRMSNLSMNLEHRVKSRVQVETAMAEKAGADAALQKMRNPDCSEYWLPLPSPEGKDQ